MKSGVATILIILATTLTLSARPAWGITRPAPTTAKPGKPEPLSQEELNNLKTRLYALEMGRQDLSAWATIFVVFVALLLAANLGVSVFQARTLARQEVEKIIAGYNAQFSGFLVQGQEKLAARLRTYEEGLDRLSEQIKQLSLQAEQYSSEVNEAVNKIRIVVEEGRAEITKEAHQAFQSGNHS